MDKIILLIIAFFILKNILKLIKSVESEDQKKRPFPPYRPSRPIESHRKDESAPTPLPLGSQRMTQIKPPFHQPHSSYNIERPIHNYRENIYGEQAARKETLDILQAGRLHAHKRHANIYQGITKREDHTHLDGPGMLPGPLTKKSSRLEQRHIILQPIPDKEEKINFNNLTEVRQAIIMSEILRPPLTRRGLFLPPYIRG